MQPTIIFFGSFGHYSALVLATLLESSLVKVTMVVTSPPFVNRKGQTEKGAVQILAEAHQIPVLTILPATFADISPNFEADFIITAGYGQLLPNSLLSEPRVAALNLHFSLLPKYRGANPGEWAILMGETETGISIIEMNENFDEGGVIFSAATPLLPTDNRETLYQKLYSLGGKYLPGVIMDVAQHQLRPQPQPPTDLPYASRFQRPDGFIEWSAVDSLLQGQPAPLTSVSAKLQHIAQLLDLKEIDAQFVERASRALYGFPGLWTIIPTAKGDKRLKILTTSVDGFRLSLRTVQVEGQKPAQWSEIKNLIAN